MNSSNSLEEPPKNENLIPSTSPINTNDLFLKDNPKDLLIETDVPTPFNKFKRQIINFFKRNFSSKTDLYIFLFFLLSVFFYLLSLLPCNELQGCYWGLGKAVYSFFAAFCLISVLIIFLILVFAIHKKNHFAHFLYIVPVYLGFFLGFEGMNYEEHGEVNAIGFALVFIIMFIIYGIVLLFRYSIKNKKYYIIVVFVVILGGLIGIFRSNLILNYSCKNWDLAFNNTRTDNDSKDYPCKLKHPGKNSCYLDAFGDFFDITEWLGLQCGSDKERKDEYDIFSEYLPEDLKNKPRIGYPITNREKYAYTVCENHRLLQKYIYQGFIDMDEYEKENQTKYKDEPTPEAYVTYDLKKKRGNITMRFIKNETLAQERKNISDSLGDNETGIYNNVLLLYLDGISRPNFFRKLKKTVQFLDQYTKYDTNPNTKNFSLFQFMKYNTIKAKTLPNIKPMFYGVSYSTHNGTNAVKYFRQKGFVTGHTGTTCGREIFGIKLNIDKDNVRWLDYDSYDHEFISLFCDLNYINEKHPFLKSYNSYCRRCLYGEPVFKYAMDYTKMFWNAYPDNKKFFRIHINEGHDPSNALLSYLDDYLFNFISDLFTSNMLKDTFVMIMSDHGLHLPGPFFFFHSDDFVIERTLGFLCVLFPNDEKLYSSGLYETMERNQQVFVTPYDIFNTLVHLAVGEDANYEEAYSKSGISLMKDLPYKEKYCDSESFKLKDFSMSNCQCPTV